MDFGMIVFIVYVVGALLSASVFRWRAGIRWHEKVDRSPGSAGAAFAREAGLKALVWPVVLALWLLQGRPWPETRIPD